MSSSNRSSRGKGRERKSSDDETQSISLSDCHGLFPIPRSYPYDTLDTLSQVSQVVYQNQEQSHPQSGNDYPGTDDSAYYPTTVPASGPAGFDDYATSIVSSRLSGPTSDAWDVQSSWTVPTAATTAPPRHNRDNAAFHINLPTATTQRYELPCEFRGCGVVFHGDEENEWIRHSEDHLRGAFPSKLRCWFGCDFGLFDAKSPEMGGNTRNNFDRRMRHIRDHILFDGSRPHDRIVDGFLIEHLRKQGEIDEQAYRDWLKPSRVPPILGSGRSGGETREYGSSRYHHRSGRAYLTVVEEEAGSSRSRDRRYDKSEKKEHRRDSHNRKKQIK